MSVQLFIVHSAIFCELKLICQVVRAISPREHRLALKQDPLCPVSKREWSLDSVRSSPTLRPYAS